MGAFLDKPITDKVTDKTEKGTIAMEPVIYAASCMQGALEKNMMDTPCVNGDRNRLFAHPLH